MLRRNSKWECVCLCVFVCEKGIRSQWVKERATSYLGGTEHCSPWHYQFIIHWPHWASAGTPEGKKIPPMNVFAIFLFVFFYFLYCKEHLWLNSPGFALAFNQHASLVVGRELAVHTLSLCHRANHSMSLPFLLLFSLPATEAPQGWSEHCRSSIAEYLCFSFMNGTPIKWPAPLFRVTASS